MNYIICLLQIPVYPGADRAILETPPSDYFYGKDGFGDVPDPNPPNKDEAQKIHAVDAMIRLVDAYPGDITIIALGPLTNIALAMRMDSSFSSKVKNIVWTGASVEGVGNVRPGIEYNAYYDYAANYIVFNSTIKPVIMVTWELIVLHAPTTVTWRKEVLGKVKSPQIEFLNKIEAYSMKSGEWSAADSKTVAVGLHPELVTKAQLVHVEAVKEGEFSKGVFLIDYTHVSHRPANAMIVKELNVEGFKNYLLKSLSTPFNGEVV